MDEWVDGLVGKAVNLVEIFGVFWLKDLTLDVSV